MGQIIYSFLDRKPIEQDNLFILLFLSNNYNGLG